MKIYKTLLSIQKRVRKHINSNFQKVVFRYFFYTLIFSSILIVLFPFILPLSFYESSVITLSISLSTAISVLIVTNFIKPSQPFPLLLSVIFSSGAGSALGAFGLISFSDHPVFNNHIVFFQLVFGGILFGLIITYVLVFQTVIDDTMEERLKRLTSEKKVLESNLKLLQAQIEPHFLFNTLSNILSLLDIDLSKAKGMMEDFIHYLRTSLSRSRKDTGTIGQEIEMIQAFLNLFKVRMEDRLHFTIDVPDQIRNLPFPPMLLQPLVENSLKHGLEPKINGGNISISAEKIENILRFTVIDTGLGLNFAQNPGVGLSNIRERLQSLYGEQGRLILKENQPSGVEAIIEVPYERD